MAVVNGHGGYMTYYADELAADIGSSALLRIDVDTWAGDWKCDYVPVTPSGSGGGRLYLPVIGNHLWTLTFPLSVYPNDPSLFPLSVGDVLYEVFFKRGTETFSSADMYDLLERTTVTDVQMIDNQLDAFRMQISGMGGVLTQGVTSL